MPKYWAVVVALLFAAGCSEAQAQHRVTRFDHVMRGAETLAPTISEGGRARLGSPTPRTAMWLGLGAGAVLGGVAGFAVWNSYDHDYTEVCIGCGIFPVASVGLGALFGAVIGAIVGDVVDEATKGRKGASGVKALAPGRPAAAADG